MNKIFVLSLHRSATQSIHELFLRSGLSAMHGVPFDSEKTVGRERDLAFIAEVLDPAFRAVDAASDLPVPALYRELEARYPDARFVVIRRRAEDWVRSVRWNLGDRPLAQDVRILYYQYLSGCPERLSDVADAELIEMHREHHRALLQHFSGNPQFALFDLEELRLGERVCTFLGLRPIALPNIDEAKGRPGLVAIILQFETLKNSRSRLFRQFCRQVVRKSLGREPSITACPGERPEIAVQFDTFRNSPSQLLGHLFVLIVR